MDKEVKAVKSMAAIAKDFAFLIGLIAAAVGSYHNMNQGIKDNSGALIQLRDVLKENVDLDKKQADAITELIIYRQVQETKEKLAR